MKRWALLAALLMPRIAYADDAAESVRFASTAVLGGNPLTFAAPVELRYERRLYAASSPVLRRNSFGAATGMVLGPFIAPWVHVDLQPLSFVSFGATWGVNALLLRTNQSFPSRASNYEVSIFGEPETTPGYSMTIEYVRLDATLQGGVGKLGFRSANAATYSVASLRLGDTVYYNQGADLLVPARGWLLSDDTSVSYEVQHGIRVGIRASLFATTYPGPVIRVGPSFSMNLRDAPGPVGRIDVFAVLQWYVRDRYRTGEAISEYIPCMSVGIRASGPLWSRP